MKKLKEEKQLSLMKFSLKENGLINPKQEVFVSLDKEVGCMKEVQ